MTLPPEEESYSPLARDVEVDDLALVVDHGVLEEFEKKTKKKNEGGGKGRRRAVRESKRAASFFFFFFFFYVGKAAALFFGTRLKGTRSLCLFCSLLTPSERAYCFEEPTSLLSLAIQQREPFSSNPKSSQNKGEKLAEEPKEKKPCPRRCSSAATSASSSASRPTSTQRYVKEMGACSPRMTRGR